MTPEEQRILLSILQQQGAQTYSGVPSGVTATGLNKQFDPRSLFLTGGVSTETIDKGVADAYASLMDEYNTKVAGPNKYEASDAFLNAIPNKWASVGGSSPEVTDYFKTAFDELYAGRATPQAMKDNIGDAPAEVQALFEAQPNVYADFETFAKNAAIYDSALAEQEYNRGQNATTVGPAPTMTDARTKYYTDAGAPEMALLPDPNARYEFDPNTFIDNSTGQYDSAKGRLGRAQAQLNDLLYSQQGRSAIQNNESANSYAQRAMVAEAQKYAEANAPSANQSAGAAAKDIFGSALRKAAIGAAIGGAGAGAAALPLAPIGAIGGALTLGVPELAGNLVDWFQGDFNKDLRAEQDAATKVAYAQQLAKLQSGYTPLTNQQALLRYSPDARQAQMTVNQEQSNVFRAERDAKLLAELLSQRLSARGQSPYANSVNNLLRLGK
jgi:hypothetical protein